MQMAVWRAHEVHESRLHEPLVILPTDIGVHEGRPGDRQRMHSVTVLQFMGDSRTVFAATARHDHVKMAIRTAVTIAQFPQFALAGRPVNHGILPLSVAAGTADAFLVKGQSWSL